MFLQSAGPIGVHQEKLKLLSDRINELIEQVVWCYMCSCYSWYNSFLCLLVLDLIWYDVSVWLSFSVILVSCLSILVNDEHINVVVVRLHQMQQMLTILTDVCCVCLSVCLSRGLNRLRRMQCTPHAMCAGSFGAAFAKCIWPGVVLVIIVFINKFRIHVMNI